MAKTRTSVFFITRKRNMRHGTWCFVLQTVMSSAALVFLQCGCWFFYLQVIHCGFLSCICVAEGWLRLCGGVQRCWGPMRRLQRWRLHLYDGEENVWGEWRSRYVSDCFLFFLLHLWLPTDSMHLKAHVCHSTWEALNPLIINKPSGLLLLNMQV